MMSTATAMKEIEAKVFQVSTIMRDNPLEYIKNIGSKGEFKER